MTKPSELTEGKLKEQAVIAVTRTNTEYHPRGSGPPYGLQFGCLKSAWQRIAGYRRPGAKVHWVINGDCCLETWLWCETERVQCHTVGVHLAEELATEDGHIIDVEAGGGVVVFGPGEVESCDELIRAWWQHSGQFNHHPWDPNGIVEFRRLNLKRQEAEPEWEDDQWAALHATDELSFEAYDNGDFERYTREEVWNRVNAAGYRWSISEGKL